MLFRSLLTKSSTRYLTGVSARNASTVGFIGLGNMGLGMAKNLASKGKELVVYDVSAEAVNALKQAHPTVKAASSPKEVASEATDGASIVSMLPNCDIVKAVYTGDDGLLSGLKAKNVLLIDSSTINPAVSKEVHGAARDAGAVFVDAPVSGGVNAAAAGTLTFMVGAENAQTFDEAKALLDLMGKNVTHCGEVGTGQAVKICNNMLLAISMIGVSETMNLGMKLGLDPKLLANILSNATGRCWSVDTYNPVPGVMENVPSSNEYKGGFGSSLMVKDLGLAQDAATKNKSPTPLGSLAHQIYRIMCEQGYAEKDFSSAFQYLKGKR